MNGPQDLGGQMGFGVVAPEKGEPVFHADWEKRALGVTLAAGAMGAWTLDESRHARESLHPADYYASSYYEIWIEALEAKGRARSHVQSVESHLRVHLEPFFKEKPLDRIGEADVTRLLVRLRRRGLKPKTARNVLSTLHSIFELGLRRRWVGSNPCKLVDLPVIEPNGENTAEGCVWYLPVAVGGNDVPKPFAGPDTANGSVVGIGVCGTTSTSLPSLPA